MSPIGNILYLNLPKAVANVHKYFDSSSNSEDCIEIPNLVKILYPLRLLRMSPIMGTSEVTLCPLLP